MKSLNYNYEQTFLLDDTFRHFDCSNDIGHSDNSSYYFASNVELDFVRRYIDIKSGSIVNSLKLNSELLKFVYDCLKVLVDQNIFWTGELDIVENDILPGEDKFLFIYRSKETSDGVYFEHKVQPLDNKELYRFLLKKLFKQSKKLRKSFILDERPL